MMIQKLNCNFLPGLLTLLLLSLFLTTLPVLSQTTLKNDNVIEMYTNGLRLIGENKHDDAITQFKEIIKSNPDFPGAYIKLIAVYKKTNKLDDGSLYFQKLLNGNPDNPFAYYGIGLVFKAKNKFQLAIENFHKSIQLLPKCASVFKDLVDCYYALKNMDGAIDYFDNFIKENPENAAAFYGLGRTYELQKNWDDGLESVTKAIQLKPDFLLAYYSKANIYEEISKFQDCQMTSEKGLLLAKEKGDKEYQTLFLNLIGIVCRKTGEPRKALEYYQQALKIDKEIGYKRGERIRMANIGNVYYSLSDYQKALEYYKIALKAADELEDIRNQIYYFNNIGAAYRKLDDLQKALEYYEQALKLSQNTGNKRAEGMVLGNIGVVYKKSGDLDKALVYYEKALIIVREIRNKKSESKILGNIGIIYKNLGNYNKALEYYELALQIDRQIRVKGNECSQLSNIGTIYFIQENYSESLDYFNRSLIIAREIENKFMEGNILTHLADIYIKTGNYSEALINCERALKIYKEIGSKDGEAFALFGIGTIKLELKNFVESINYNQKALLIGEKIKSPVITWDAYASLASIYEKQGDLQKSLQHYQLAVDELEKARSDLSTKEFKAGFLERKIDVYEKVIYLLAKLHGQHPLKGYDRQSFQFAERAKARAFLDLLAEARAGVSKGVDQKFKQQERDVFKKISHIQIELRDSTLSEQDWEKLVEELKQVEEKQEALKRKIRRSNVKYANLVYPEPYNLNQVRENIIDKNTALLEFCLGEDHSCVWIITRENSFLHPLPKRSEIEKNVEEYVKTISKPVSLTNPLTRHHALGFELYNRLLAPFADSFENKSSLIIIPDGILFYLPFETLITKKVKNKEQAFYLLKDFEISYAPSSSVLCYLQEGKEKARQGKMQLLAFGDPHFDSVKEIAALRGGKLVDEDSLSQDNKLDEEEINVRGLYEQRGFQFKRLPFSGIEVKEIGDLFPGEKRVIYLGEKAKEEIVKRESLEKFKYIHFATHGIIEQKIPSRSGIVLSINKNSSEDGFLQVNEIFNLKMDADLVVLSACKTGLGKIRKGEGIVGLTRAFMYAGAPSVVVSLWNINDRSTADFMKFFYKQLLEGKNKAEALQLAKLEMLQSERKLYQHPFFWAPFVLIGESN